MLISNFNTLGTLTIRLTDPEGNVKQEQTVNNLVVHTGKEYIAQRIANNSTAVMNYMAVGTSNTSPAVSNTTLIEEIPGSRVTIGASNTTVVSNTTSYIATFHSGVGTGAITEAGIFNDPSAGIMLCRTTFPVVNKGALDTLSITWNITAQ